MSDDKQVLNVMSSADMEKTQSDFKQGMSINYFFPILSYFLLSKLYRKMLRDNFL